jgi:hypothetical protein
MGPVNRNERRRERARNEGRKKEKVFAIFGISQLFFEA